MNMRNGSDVLEVELSVTMIPSNTSADIYYRTAKQMSEDVFMDTLIPSFVYTFILFIIGVPGNFFVCYIYYFKWTKKTSRIFIIALAVFDLINNVVSLPTEMVLLLNFYTFDQPVICKLSRFVTFIMNGASSTVLVGIAVDRLKGICYWSSMQPMRIRTAKRIVCFAVVFALLTGWPSLFIYGTYTINLQGGVVLKTCLIDDIYNREENTIYPKIYSIYLLVSNVAYDVTFIVLYSIIGRQIFRNRQFGRTKNQYSERSSSNTTIPKRRPSALSNSSSCPEDEVFIYLPSNNLNKSTHSLTSFHIKPTRYVFRSLSDVRKDSIIHKNNIQRPGFGGRPVRSVSFNDRTKIVRSISVLSEGYIHGRRFRVGKTTIMLFLVTVIFIGSFVPYCIIAILRLVYPMLYTNSTNLQKTMYQLFLRTYLLSSAMNPVIYNGLNTHFRRECKKLMKTIACVYCRCKMNIFSNKNQK